MPISDFFESDLDFYAFSKVGIKLGNEDVVMHYPHRELKMSAEKIGELLWTAHHELDDLYHQHAPESEDGAAASTTIVSGNTIVTATVSDVVTFVLAWDEDGNFIGVKLLSREQKLNSPAETCRIEAAGIKTTMLTQALKTIARNKNKEKEQALQKYGPVVYYQPDGETEKWLCSLSSTRHVPPKLSLPRSLGDYHFKPATTADSTIDVTTISGLLKHFGVKAFGTLLVMTASDGFTNATHYLNLTYEDYVTSLLKNTHFNQTNEKEIAELLVNSAAQYSKKDDKTVLLQAIIKEGKRTGFNGALACYDGHGGRCAADYMAKWFSRVWDGLLKLSEKEYVEHPSSVHKHTLAYHRDNGESYKIVQLEEKEAQLQLAKEARVRFIWRVSLLLMGGGVVVYSLKIPTIQHLLSLIHAQDGFKSIFTKSLRLLFNFTAGSELPNTNSQLQYEGNCPGCK